MPRGDSQRLTIEYVREMFNKKDLELLETEYVNAHTHMKYRCKICNHEDTVIWNSIQRGSGCPICAIEKQKDKQKLDIEFVKLECQKYGFTFLDDKYINTKTPFICRCKCGEITRTTIDAIRRGSGCRKCGVENMKAKERLSYDFVKDYFKKYGYKLLEDIYINWETKMKYECDNGHINYMHWNNFKSGKRCPDCEGSKKKTIEEIREEFAKEDYQLLDDIYINNSVPLNYKCPKGHFSKISWGNFLTGQRCKYCNESKGEEKIYNYLVSNDYKLKREYRMDKCRYKNPLPFDFAILNEAEELQCLIEYDGEQHFRSVDIFGGDKAFESTKMRDQIKNQYCQTNDIKLIRIPYTEINNVENILDNFLFKNNQIGIKQKQNNTLSQMQNT
jgi:rubredoxin